MPEIEGTVTDCESGVRIAGSAAGIAGFTGGNNLAQIWSRSGHRVALTTAITEPVNVPGHTLR